MKLGRVVVVPDRRRTTSCAATFRRRWGRTPAPEVIAFTMGGGTYTADGTPQLRARARQEIWSTTTYVYHTICHARQIRLWRKPLHVCVLIYNIAAWCGVRMLHGVDYYILLHRVPPLYGRRIGGALNPGPYGCENVGVVDLGA
eukprot:2191869-Pyramimonas_sp.AAC.1